MVGLIAFLGNFHRIDEFYRYLFLANIILSIMICGALMEQKKWVIYAEYVRLGLILFSLNTFYYIWFVDWFTIMISCSLILVAASIIYFTLTWRRVQFA